MGIVVLSVAILPMLGVGGMQLFRAEVPGPTADRLAPRIQDTAKILWTVYVGLTGVQTVLLMLGGMTLFEAVNHSFTTLSTGGFSTRDRSVGGFESAYIDIVITVFMFIAGANFSLHYWLLRGRGSQYWKVEEFRYYALFTGIATVLLTIAILSHTDVGIFYGLRLALFQSVSIFTTTGYGTGDYLLWGFGAHALIFTMMFCGACAGSTAGGVKVMRVVLLAKHANRVVKKTLHPRAVFNVRYSGKVVDDDVMMTVLGFFLLYFVLFLGSAILVAHFGAEFTTAMGAVVSALGNVGPGLGEVGPATTYTHLPGASKIVLALCMLFGRLELFTVFVVLTPMFWRRVG
jgi:trk system potassium uptake protein TrkH